MLWLALGIFSVFALNVFLGASGHAVFLNDLGEMLVLFAASATFVVAILKKEAAREERLKDKVGDQG